MPNVWVIVDLRKLSTGMTLPTLKWLAGAAYRHWSPTVNATSEKTAAVLFHPRWSPNGRVAAAFDELVLSEEDEDPEIVSADFEDDPDFVPDKVDVSPEITVTSAAAVCDHTDCDPVNPHWL